MENPPIFHGKIHYKWPFSIAMLVHQRVSIWRSPKTALFLAHLLRSCTASILQTIGSAPRRLGGVLIINDRDMRITQRIHGAAIYGNIYHQYTPIYRAYMGLSYKWEFQDPKLEVPTIYKAYFSGLCKGISPQNMAKHMVLTYLHFGILKFPLTIGI